MRAALAIAALALFGVAASAQTLPGCFLGRACGGTTKVKCESREGRAARPRPPPATAT